MPHKPAPGRNRDRDLAQLAARQWGVVSMAQLLRLGFTREEVRWLLRRGRLHRLHQGVYAVGHSNITMRGKLFAATLACGDTSFLSHASAAAERKLRPSYPYRIELTVPANSTPKRPGLVIHRTRVPITREEVTTYNGLRVATVPRILIDLSARERPGVLQDLVTGAIRRQQFDPFAVEAAAQRHARRPGVGMLKDALARYRPGPDRKSELERSVKRALERRPQIPPGRWNEHIEGWEIDCHWPDQRLVLELDGRPYHTVIEDMDKDNRKNRKLQLAGWRVMRVTDFEWRWDRDGMLADLCQMLGIPAA